MANKLVPVVGTAISKGVQYLNPLDVIREVVGGYTEYCRMAEQEATKRREIEAWESTRLEEIKAQKDLFLTYMSEAFEERAKIFSDMFRLVDAAMAKGEVEQIGIILTSITDLAKKTPFKDLIDISKTKAMIRDRNHVHDL
jgi:hypothetical protein